MSHDIQLFNNSNLPSVQDDSWTHNTALGPSLGQQNSPVKKVQRLLRGRYKVAVVLAGIGALCGAYFGWTSQQPKYSSEGIVGIKPVIPSILTNDKTLPYYDKFVQSQVNIIASQRVL